MIFHYLILFFLSCCFSLVLTPLVRALAIRIGAVDRPEGRKIHTCTIPRLGGLSIALAGFLTFIVGRGIEHWTKGFIHINFEAFGPLLLGGGIVFLAGILDDLKPVPSWVKFIFQGAAAALAIWFGNRIEIFSFFGGRTIHLGLWSIPLTFLWIVGITNAFNLIDGLDGLSAGLALIAAGTSATIFLLMGDFQDPLLLIILVGALVGFLRYNFNPATIFMGDSGSLLVGYVLAVTAVRGSQKGATALAVVIPLLVFGLPIIDTLLSMVRRMTTGFSPARSGKGPFRWITHRAKKVFQSDQQHIHHRLIGAGLSHRQAVITLYSLALGLSLLALLSVLAKYRNSGVILIAVGLATLVGIRKLGYHEVAILRSGTLLSWYNQLALKSPFFIGFVDMILLGVAFWGGFLLKYHGLEGTAIRGGYLLGVFPWVVVLQLGALLSCGLYRGWREVGVGDLTRIGLGIGTGAVLSYVVSVIFLPMGLLGFFCIDGLLAMVLVGGCRVLIQLWRDDLLVRFFSPRSHGKTKLKRVIIYGTANAEEAIAREASVKRAVPLEIVGFVDDDPDKVGLAYNGKPILGQGEDLLRLVTAYKIDEVIIVAPRVAGEEIKEFVQNCRKAFVPYRMTTGWSDSVDSDLQSSRLREVHVEDLFRREPVKTDFQAIRGFLSGKRVMVTGAGGSIGSELCRQVVSYGAQVLVLVERNEYNLSKIEHELVAQSRQEISCLPVLMDVSNRDHMEAVMRETHPDIILHAAGYKHASLVEDNVRMSFENNVMGTKHLADFAPAFGVDVFVLVSTYKAVKPVNVVGATKRACELYLRKLARGPEGKITRYLTVRFDNELDFSGSLIPAIREQIVKGGPVVVTHPEMTRFFMGTPEICQLIFQCAVLGKGGETFVLDMGEPINILRLARDMIHLSYPSKDVNIPVTFTGLKPGEKLQDEFTNDDETLESTAYPKIFRARVSSLAELNGQLDWFGKNVPLMTESAARMLLEKLVPGYTPVAAKSSPGLRDRT